MTPVERDTGTVTGEPPPPPPPPPVGGSAPSPPAPAPPARQTSPTPAAAPPLDVDWERMRDLATRWYAPLLERQGWMAALYLLVGTFSAVGFFIALTVVGTIVVGLLFAVVGIFLIRPAFALAEVMARAERSMASWVGVDITPRPVTPMTGIGLRALTDAERWRQVGFVLLNVVIGTLLGNVGLIGFIIVQQAVLDGGLFGTGFDVNPFAGFSIAFGLVLAAAALGAAPRIAVFVAGFKAQITQWFLGVDQLEEARQRADTLALQRDDILDAVAIERRRIERNLHDGVQQQLVAIGLDLGMAEQQLDDDPDRARELIVNARDKVRGSIGELRQLGRGLHPSVLSDRGIDAALSAVVAGAPIPISVQVDDDLQLSTDVAETVYFVANESIANVLKHSNARAASIHVNRVAANVRVSIHDDGTGGADPGKGSGIAGIRARVKAMDGTLTISSPAGGPTSVVAEIPRSPIGGPAGGPTVRPGNVRGPGEDGAASLSTEGAARHG